MAVTLNPTDEQIRSLLVFLSGNDQTFLDELDARLAARSSVLDTNSLSNSTIGASDHKVSGAKHSRVYGPRNTEDRLLRRRLKEGRRGEMLPAKVLMRQTMEEQEEHRKFLDAKDDLQTLLSRKMAALGRSIPPK